LELKYHKTQKVKEKVSLFIEYIWLVAAIISLIAGIHKTYYHGFEQSWLFFILVPVALIMYSLRRHLRKQQNNTKE